MFYFTRSRNRLRVENSRSPKTGRLRNPADKAILVQSRSPALLQINRKWGMSWQWEGITAGLSYKLIVELLVALHTFWLGMGQDWGLAIFSIKHDTSRVGDRG